jgi:maleate isomerase
MSQKAAFAMHKHFLGTVTPSGNTVVERATLALLRDFPSVSPHFSRSPVFGATDPYPDAYDWTNMLRAAELLGLTFRSFSYRLAKHGLGDREVP